MYGGATLVGLSRMYHNKHWASDVALGAAVGTFSGLKVVRYSHAHPDNKVDRVMLMPSSRPMAREARLPRLLVAGALRRFSLIRRDREASAHSHAATRASSPP